MSNMELILSSLEENRLDEGYSLLMDEIDRAEQDFMEKLTTETATDLIGLVVLLGEFCKKEKKPWKATPQMKRVSGALRFLNDFVSDRGMVSDVYFQFGKNYEYAGFFPEAAECFEKSVEVDSKIAHTEDAVYYCLINTMRCGEKISKEAKKLFTESLSLETYLSLCKEAEEALDHEILRDPVEREEKFLDVRYDVEKAVDEMLLSDHDDETPFCVRYWEAKKQILSSAYGIDWKTPIEMNPNIRFY